MTAATMLPHRGFQANRDAPPGLFFVGVLAAAAQKGHSRLNLGGPREIRAASA
jgi:hypothetical protein